MARRNQYDGSAIPMEVGERDRLVTIQQTSDGVSASGFPTETWTTLTTAWMRAMDITGMERFAAQQLSAQSVTQWEMGYRSDMDPELVNVSKTRRLLYQNRVYDITAASQIGRREGIELITLAKVG